MKNWKTTLLGFVAGLAMIFGNAVTNKQADPNAPAVNVGNLLPAAVIAILGAVAKDGDVTGGTRS